jgi:hypothetical protein
MDGTIEAAAHIYNRGPAEQAIWEPVTMPNYLYQGNPIAGAIVIRLIVDLKAI